MLATGRHLVHVVVRDGTVSLLDGTRAQAPAPAAPAVTPRRHRSTKSLYYSLCYDLVVPVRESRSVSLNPELAADIDSAAAEAGTTFSGWMAEAAAHRLRIEEGRKGIRAWEAEHGPLTDEERAEGRARARRSLGRR